MTDQELLIKLILEEALASIPEEQRSGSDRLRPPYRSQLSGAIPATAGSGRDLEVGFDKLPYSYRQALTHAPPSRLDVGSMPSGYNYSGFLSPTRKPRALLGIDAQTMAHELIHELGQRRGGFPGLDKVDEEMFVRSVVGDPEHPALRRSFSEREREEIARRGRQVDEMIRREFPEPSEGWLATVLRFLGSKR